jgi:hypothetical protein
MRIHPLAIVGIAVASVFVAESSATAALPAKLKAGDVELSLNGSGARTKYLMQMYVAALYVAEPSRDAAAIVAADAPMAFRIEITSGLVSEEKLVESLNEGFTAALGGDTEPLRAEIDQFRKCFAAKIAKGDVFNLVYLPEHGVIVLKNNERVGAVAGQPFKQAQLGIWLGAKPADDDLKTALLGR